MNPINWTRDETPVHIFNPLTIDVIVPIRDENNVQSDKIVPSLEITTYPRWLAEIVKKHVVDAVINDRELGYQTPEDLAKIQAEVEV